LKAGFPASNASNFLARARRCFRVGFAFADFFRSAFPERVNLALRRFNGVFFLAIDALFHGCFV
jgi:hypothetical protein